jgi:hypothetical protein
MPALCRIVSGSCRPVFLPGNFFFTFTPHVDTSGFDVDYSMTWTSGEMKSFSKVRWFYPLSPPDCPVPVCPRRLPSPTDPSRLPSPTAPNPSAHADGPQPVCPRRRPPLHLPEPQPVCPILTVPVPSAPAPTALCRLSQPHPPPTDCPTPPKIPLSHCHDSSSRFLHSSNS